MVNFILISKLIFLEISRFFHLLWILEIKLSIFKVFQKKPPTRINKYIHLAIRSLVLTKNLSKIQFWRYFQSSNIVQLGSFLKIILSIEIELIRFNSVVEISIQSLKFFFIYYKNLLFNKKKIRPPRQSSIDEKLSKKSVKNLSGLLPPKVSLISRKSNYFKNYELKYFFKKISFFFYHLKRPKRKNI